MPRDQLPGLAGEEAVRLRVVHLAASDRGDEALELGRVHLVVGRHHRGDVHALLAGAQVAGDDGCSDAAVALVADQLDGFMGGMGRLGHSLRHMLAAFDSKC